MKSLYIFGAALAAGMLMLAATACSNLEDKSVLVQAGGTGIKATTAADSSTGTATPTVWMGVFDFLFLDHPKDAPGLVYYKSQAATMNASAVTTTFVWIKEGAAANVSVKPQETLSIPGLKVVAGDSVVNISTLSEAANPDSASGNEAAK
jgi:hypothetical protein